MTAHSMALTGCLMALMVFAVAPLSNAQTCNTNLLTAVSNNPQLSTLKTVINAAGLNTTLANSSLAVTVFAPNNAAFEPVLALLMSMNLTLADVTSADNNVVASILLYHIVPVPARSNELSNGQELPTLYGQNLTVAINGSTVNIVAEESQARVVTANVAVCQSVVHIVDTVLLPAALADIPPYMPATPATPGAMSPPPTPPGTPATPPPPAGSSAFKVGGSVAMGVVASAAAILLTLA